MLAYQWYELTRPMLFNLMPAFGLYHTDELLRLARISDGNHQASAGFQLSYQRIRYPGPAGCYQNPIVRTIGIPAQRTVESLNRRIVNSQLTYAALRLAGQFTKALNRVNLRCQLRQHSRLIT